MPASLILLRDPLGGAELLIHQAAGGLRPGSLRDRQLEALEDQLLAVRDPQRLLAGRFPGDPEPLVLERAPVVEGEDEEPGRRFRRAHPRNLSINRPRRRGSRRRSGAGCGPRGGSPGRARRRNPARRRRRSA